MWKVNDEVFGEEAEIDARDSYTVKCEYDADEYYFVNSVPACFSNTDGYVEFPRSDMRKDDSIYEVELHKYLSANITSKDKLKKAISVIKVDNNEQAISASIEKLKLGQMMYLEVDSEYRIYSDDVDLSVPEKKGNKLAYKFDVQDTKNENISIEVNKKYVVTLADKEEHGKCIFKLDGKVVIGTVKMEAGQKLEMEYTITDENYEINKGFIEGLLGKKKERKKLTITSELDGKTITAEDYIKIVKKGAK